MKKFGEERFRDLDRQWQAKFGTSIPLQIGFRLEDYYKEQALDRIEAAIRRDDPRFPLIDLNPDVLY